MLFVKQLQTLSNEKTEQGTSQVIPEGGGMQWHVTAWIKAWGELILLIIGET